MERIGCRLISSIRSNQQLSSLKMGTLKLSVLMLTPISLCIFWALLSFHSLCPSSPPIYSSMLCGKCARQWLFPKNWWVRCLCPQSFHLFERTWSCDPIGPSSFPNSSSK